MFCPNCGKEIPEGAEFCPSCGGKVSGSTSDTMKDTLKKASEAVTSTAKNVGKRVNEATNGKAGEFAQSAQEKAKETAQNFTADIKQATQDKDAKGFFTKNKYRNTKLIAGLVVLFIVLGSIFVGKGGGGLIDKSDKEIIREYIEERYSGKNKIDSIKYLREKDGKKYYMVRMTYIPINDNDVAALMEIDNKEIKLICGGVYPDVWGYYRDMIDR